MYPTAVRRKKWSSEDTVKKCVSFPLHEETLIDDWKKLAKEDYVSDSQFVRKLIKQEASRRKDRQTKPIAIIGG